MMTRDRFHHECMDSTHPVNRDHFQFLAHWLKQLAAPSLDSRLPTFLLGELADYFGAAQACIWQCTEDLATNTPIISFGISATSASLPFPDRRAGHSPIGLQTLRAALETPGTPPLHKPRLLTDISAPTAHATNNEAELKLLQQGIRSVWWIPSSKGQLALSLLLHHPSTYRSDDQTLLTTLLQSLECHLHRSPTPPPTVHVDGDDKPLMQLLKHSSDGFCRVSFHPPIPLAADQALVLEQLREGRINATNEALASGLNKPVGVNFTGQTLRELITDTELTPLLQAAIEAQFGRVRTHSTQFLDDHVQRIETSCQGEIADGALTQLWLTRRDLTHEQRLTNLLTHQSNHDALTQLRNRNALIGDLDTAIAIRGPQKRAVGLMLLDLDRFKDYNDTFGHPFGDEIITQLAHRLGALAQRYDATVYRVGGDEFALLFDALHDLSKLHMLSMQLLAEVQEPLHINDMALSLDASIGISGYPMHGNNAASLLRCADVALNQAKHAPFSAMQYEPAHDHFTKRRLSILTGLRPALKNDGMHLVFQPKMLLAGRAVSGFEALLRWHPNDGPPVSPNEFIPLAEVSNQMHDLTRWVVDAVIQQQKAWRLQGVAVPLAFNISPANLADVRFMHYLSEQCARHQVSPSQLHIEITESALMNNLKDSRRILNNLRSQGFTVCIDDFGTGYSSLSYLRDLPADIIKIDMSFIRNLVDNPRTQIIVESLIKMSHSLGLVVVAEGVEDEATLAMLEGMGCDQIQGFILAPGLSATDAQAFLTSTSSQH
ncbi:bifunctional diguanylate cyclase/phosphodiesterase [Salinispirillum sp. LH 10-3-1]|uniref:Bifunctional diguanylate cyclase/phosphodiesterase n=1 Tax=Salinispirillum sp. LH 10-3-1 TaxID=2952525 RepID=A0AB38YID1_9GAMM